jgi:hypothetical protein
VEIPVLLDRLVRRALQGRTAPPGCKEIRAPLVLPERPVPLGLQEQSALLGLQEQTAHRVLQAASVSPG